MPVPQSDKERLIKLYEDRYSEMGYDVRTVGWKNIEDQTLRFRILCDIGDLTGRTVCDIGCGFGDLIKYLQQRFRDVHYTGIDIVPSLIAHAKRLHSNCDLRCLDILDPQFNQEADYFLLSGALNFLFSDNANLTERTLRRMFALCRRGVAANFLSSYVNYQDPRNFHHRPEDVLSVAKSITKYVTLRHDYPLWEFTIFLYKETPIPIPNVKAQHG